MIKLYDLNMNEIYLNDIQCLSFNYPSPSPSFETDSPDNVDGFDILGTKIEGRPLKASFFIQAKDKYDYKLLKNEAYKIFYPKREIYIIEVKEPGKRWKAVTAASFEIEPLSLREGRFQVDLSSSKPYSESVGTSLAEQTFDNELWQIGQGLITDETSYVHNTTSFKIFNAGDITINPRRYPLIIKYKGASNNLQIKNNTTLETWSYTGQTTVDDTLELNRLRSLKNSVVNVFKDTNRRSISLAPGWNDIELIGTDGSFEISFDFRFYYV